MGSFTPQINVSDRMNNQSMSQQIDQMTKEKSLVWKLNAQFKTTDKTWKYTNHETWCFYKDTWAQ